MTIADAATMGRQRASIRGRGIRVQLRSASLEERAVDFGIVKFLILRGGYL